MEGRWRRGEGRWRGGGGKVEGLETGRLEAEGLEVAGIGKREEWLA